MPAETTRSGWRAAAEALAERDPVLAHLYAEHGAPTIGPGPPPSERFAALANAITHQQLAGAAAAAIWARVQTAVGEDVTAEAVLAAGPEVLRSAGLSTAKATSMLELADRSLDGTIDWARIQRLSDDEVVASAVLLLNAGHEASVNVFGNGLTAMLRRGLEEDPQHPELAGKLAELGG